MLQYLPIYYYYTQLEMVQKRATEPYGLMPACTNINNPTQWKIYTNPPEYIDYGIYIKPPIPNEKIPINRKRTIESVLQTEIKFPVFSQVNVNDYTLPGELTSFEVRDAHDINRRLRDQTIQPANNLYGVTPNNTQRQQQQQQQQQKPQQPPPPQSAASSLRNQWGTGGSAAKIPNNPPQTNIFYGTQGSDDDMSSGGEDEMMDMDNASYGIGGLTVDPTVMYLPPKCASGKRIFSHQYFNDPRLVKNIGENHRVSSGTTTQVWPPATELDIEYFEAIYNNDMVTANAIYEQGKLIARITQRMTRLRPESYMVIMEVLELNFYNNLSFAEFHQACRIRNDINANKYKIAYDFSGFALYLAVPVLKEKISTYENFNNTVIALSRAAALMAKTTYDPEELQYIETLKQLKSKGLNYNATLGACKINTIEIKRHDDTSLPWTPLYYYLIFSEDGKSFTPIQMQREIFLKRISTATAKVFTKSEDYEFPYAKVGHRVKKPTIFKQNEFFGKPLQSTFTKTALDNLYAIPV